MVSECHNRMQTGFSLMEILISLLILSIGMLGLGGLQLSSLKTTNNAHYRTVASMAATDLADRIRANPLAVSNGLYTASLAREDCDTALAKVCEGASECSAQELAAYDLHRVNCGVAKDSHQTGGVQYVLPQALLGVNCDGATCTTGLEHVINIEWNETDDEDADDKAQFRSYELRFIP